jgi:hypothetical protein
MHANPLKRIGRKSRLTLAIGTAAAVLLGLFGCGTPNPWVSCGDIYGNAVNVDRSAFSVVYPVTTFNLYSTYGGELQVVALNSANNPVGDDGGHITTLGRHFVMPMSATTIQVWVLYIGHPRSFCGAFNVQ